MFQPIRNFLTNNLSLKLIALVMALLLWFYVVNELQQGSAEERMFLRRWLPSETMASKKLTIRPVVIGKPRRGYAVAHDKVLTAPDYCIVVGPPDILGKVRSAYTMPIDVSGAMRSFNKSVALNPIAPGIYMEETRVEVTVPIQKEPG